MNKKVYCKNCKYNGESMFMGSSYWEFCENKQAEADKREELEKDRIIEKQEYNKFTDITDNTDKVVVAKSDFNEEGKCKYYKRKWWKFWK